MSKIEELEGKIARVSEETARLEDKSFDLAHSLLSKLDFDDVRMICERKGISLEDAVEAIRDGQIDVDEVLELMDVSSEVENDFDFLNSHIDEIHKLTVDENIPFEEASRCLIQIEKTKRAEAKKAEEKRIKDLEAERERRALEVEPLVRYLDDLLEESENQDEKVMLQEIKEKIK